MLVFNNRKSKIYTVFVFFYCWRFNINITSNTQVCEKLKYFRWITLFSNPFLFLPIFNYSILLKVPNFMLFRYLLLFYNFGLFDLSNDWSNFDRLSWCIKRIFLSFHLLILALSRNIFLRRLMMFIYLLRLLIRPLLRDICLTLQLKVTLLAYFRIEVKLDTFFLQCVPTPDCHFWFYF